MDNCAICLEEIDEYRATLPCSHVFHTLCLIKHAHGSNVCPLCRHIIIPSLKRNVSIQFIRISNSMLQQTEPSIQEENDV